MVRRLWERNKDGENEEACMNLEAQKKDPLSGGPVWSTEVISGLFPPCQWNFSSLAFFPRIFQSRRWEKERRVVRKAADGKTARASCA